jgi:Ca2+-binding RTX toxin-like protein
VGTTGTTVFSQAGLIPNQAIAPEQFHIGNQATTTAQRFIYDSTSGLLSFDRDGSGANIAIQIAVLSPDLALTNTNIIPFDDQSPLPDPTDPTDPTGVINGTPNDDLLTGSDQADILKGFAGKDILKGKAGQDILLGGLGSDRLIGGKGRDIFVLETGAGIDHVIDFKDGVDRLGLTGGLRFKQLKLIQKGQDTLIRLGSDRLIILDNIQRSQITAADFTKVSIFD